MTDEDVSILGAGVVGLSSGIWLELSGYDTTIYAADVPYRTPPSERVHSMASNYAAASVIPHGINCPSFHEVMETSQDIFALLWKAASMGVRQQRHYKAYETGTHDELPQYARHMDWFEPLSTDRLPAESVPCRSDVTPGELEGWVFPSYFVEMGAYMPVMADLYEHIGGRIIERHLTRDEFTALPGDLLMNCAGYAARELVDDDAPVYAARGHLVHVYADEFPTDERARPFSYNYKPDPERVADGVEGSVYSYPRTDGIVLGGSRLKGRPDVGGEWTGDSIQTDSVTVSGVEVPARIIETNRDILAETCGLDIDNYEWEAFTGWRPIRDPDGEGVRIEIGELDDRLVVHNYGHGGAGVTLSWGSAREAAALVRDVLGDARGDIDVGRRFAVARHLQRYISDHQK